MIPAVCPECGEPWRTTSRTMGAALGQPHRAVCVRGHHWHEGPIEPDAVRYDRAVLVDVLVHHYRKDIETCGCGWGKLGYSHPEHVADVYETTVSAAEPPV